MARENLQDKLPRSSQRPVKKASRLPARPRKAPPVRLQRRKSRTGRRVTVAVLSLVMLFFAGYLVHQLYQIQIVNHGVYADRAASQLYKKIAEQPQRGRILDRNGIELAGTTYVYRIGVTPKDVRSISGTVTSDQIAQRVADILELDRNDVKAALAQEDETYIPLASDVSRPQADLLNEYKSEHQIGGIRIDAEPKRYYTNGQLASQVIGFTRHGDENLTGQLGIELYYNDLLTGQPGYTYGETDNYSMGGLPFTVPTSLRAKNGENLMLNLDINIQKIVQEELEKTIRLYDITQGGVAIVMDPYTGAILAMADYPYFSSEKPTEQPVTWQGESWDTSDPATIEYLSASVWRNRAISDGYRPGSTMKALTLAMTLEEANATINREFNDAPIQVRGETISCHNKVGHGHETLEQAFWRSCNPVFAQLSLQLGVDRFYDYVHAFGLRDKTNIDLPAESTGLIHSQPTELDMATFSYGESATVTPLQLVTAFCTFANGGRLVQPMIAKASLDEQGQTLREYRNETVRNVIADTTAAQVKDMLSGVVMFGTGSGAYVEGYSVGGKTSTATYVEGSSVTGQPSDNPDDYYTLSFASIAPTETPEIVTLVVLYKPENQKLSSSIAARTNGQIVSRTLEYLGTEREYSENDVSRLSAVAPVPNLSGLTYAQAGFELMEQGFRAQAGESGMGDGTIVRYQWPAAGTELHAKSLIYLYPEEPAEDILVTVPDFTGKNVHECIRAAADAGLNIRIDGDSLGLAVDQNPLPSFHPGQTPTLPGTPDESEPTDVTTPSSEAAETGPEGEDRPDSSEDPDGEDPDPQPEGLRYGGVVTIRFAAVDEHPADADEDGTAGEETVADSQE
ncbi:MAG: penicillin-binding transpeptidase domain-containing protein [Eubacteriales bacterium]|nr:penicillin-binding transpeptidase domain-containing protein [Eubacteriales bacterium]